MSKAGPLKAGLKLMREEGLYTDLTIRCNNGTEHKVHKNVVCSQSSFFQNACKPDSPFKEARTGVIELVEDDPPIVEAMLTFFYEEEYNDEPQKDGEGDDEESDDDVLDDKSGMTALDKNDRYLRQLMFHLKCYMLAQKYEINHMMQCALEKIRIFLRSPNYYCCHGFPAAVHFVYENTVGTMRGGRQLRHALLQVCVNHLPTLLRNPRFDATLGAVAEFWRELARAQAELPQTTPTWVKCPKCSTRFPMLLHHPDRCGDVPADTDFTCHFCRKITAPHSKWVRRYAIPEPLDVASPESRKEHKELVEAAMRLAPKSLKRQRDFDEREESMMWKKASW